MKKLLGGVVVLGGLFAASYFGTGILTERAIQRTLVDLKTTKGVELTVTSYDRGFFRSHAVLNWVVNLAPAQLPDQSGQMTSLPAKQYLLPIDLSICHGPIMLTKSGIRFGLGYAKGHLAMPKEYEAQLQSFFNTKETLPRLDLSLLITLLNNAKINLALPKFSLEAPTGQTKVHFYGVTSKTYLSLNLSHMSGKASFGGLDLGKDHTMLTVGKVTSDYHLTRTLLGLYEGEANFNLEKLSLTNDKQSSFLLKSFFVESSCAEKKGLFHSKLTTRVGEVVAEGLHYGPAVLSMSLDNLDAQVLSKINRQLQQLQNQSLLAKQKGFLSLLPNLPALLSKGATFTVSDFSVTMPQGLVKGDFRLSLPNNGSVTNPFQLVSHAKGSGYLSVPAALLSEVMESAIREKLSQPQPNMPALSGDELEQKVKTLAAERIQALVTAGALKPEAQSYTVALILESGAIQVNGKPFTTNMIAM